MRKMLPGYFFLFFLSFVTFSWIFQSVAHAQSNVVVSPESQIPQTPPTPTIFEKVAVSYQPVQPKQADAPLPTPTIYMGPPTQPTTAPKAVAPQPTQTPEPPVTLAPTATPTPEVTATPEPTTAPVSTGPVDLESLFSQYAGSYGVDINMLKKIARCESGFNTNANNSGLYLGMFQFGSQTWIANRARMGLDTNPDLRTNPEEAIRTAAYVISTRGVSPWPNCH